MQVLRAKSLEQTRRQLLLLLLLQLINVFKVHSWLVSEAIVMQSWKETVFIALLRNEKGR